MADPNATRALRRGRLRLRLRRFLAPLAAAAGAALVAAACVPVTNPPAGGGGIVTGTYRIGPFDIAAMGQPGWQSSAGRTGVPRPTDRSGSRASTSYDRRRGRQPRERSRRSTTTNVLLIDNSEPTPPLSRARQRSPDRDGAHAAAPGRPLRLPGWVPSDRWDSLWHVMNMSDTARTVYIQYKVGTSRARPRRTRRVVPLLHGRHRLRQLGVRRSRRRRPGQRAHEEQTWASPVRRDRGTTQGGHVHAGGIDITLPTRTPTCAAR